MKLKRLLCALTVAALVAGACPAFAAEIPAVDPPSREVINDDAGWQWLPLGGSDYWRVWRQSGGERGEYAIYSADKTPLIDFGVYNDYGFAFTRGYLAAGKDNAYQYLGLDLKPAFGMTFAYAGDFYESGVANVQLTENRSGVLSCKGKLLAEAPAGGFVTAGWLTPGNLVDVTTGMPRGTTDSGLTAYDYEVSVWNVETGEAVLAPTRDWTSAFPLPDGSILLQNNLAPDNYQSNEWAHALRAPDGAQSALTLPGFVSEVVDGRYLICSEYFTVESVDDSIYGAPVTLTPTRSAVYDMQSRQILADDLDYNGDMVGRPFTLDFSDGYSPAKQLGNSWWSNGRYGSGSNGKFGLLSPAGGWALAPAYDSLQRVAPGRYFAMKGDARTLIGPDGKTLRTYSGDVSAQTLATRCSDWAQPELMQAVDAGLLPESERGLYEEPVTRLQFCRLLVGALDLAGAEAPETLGVSFPDTDDAAVLRAAKLGIVQGKGDGFAPFDDLTRQEAATMLSRAADVLALKAPDDAAAPFADANNIADWAARAVSEMRALGVMQGEEQNRFSPEKPYTKEQSVLTLLRLYTKTTLDNSPASKDN